MQAFRLPPAPVLWCTGNCSQQVTPLVIFALKFDHFTPKLILGGLFRRKDASTDDNAGRIPPLCLREKEKCMEMYRNDRPGGSSQQVTQAGRKWLTGLGVVSLTTRAIWPREQATSSLTKTISPVPCTAQFI